MIASYKRRPQDFKRKILISNINVRKDLLEEEYKWLSLIKNEELGKRYYNLSKKHFGHWTIDENKRKSISEKNSIGLKRYYQEHPEAIIQNSENRKKYYENSENRKKNSIKTKEAMARPEIREKYLNGFNEHLKKIRKEKERKKEQYKINIENNKKIKCIYCGYEGHLRIITRFHNENCEHKFGLNWEEIMNEHNLGISIRKLSNKYNIHRRILTRIIN
jgi:hypothetical protein